MSNTADELTRVYAHAKAWVSHEQFSKDDPIDDRSELGVQFYDWAVEQGLVDDLLEAILDEAIKEIT